jgi:DNA-binding GntR family transcriptional regulator
MSFPSIESAIPLSSQAYGLIRTAIQTGELKPDSRITERSLAKRLAISPTPIREALKRLEQEGLIERKGRKRLVVAYKSEMEIAEIAYIRAILAGIAARLAGDKITEDELNEMQHLYEQFKSLGTTAESEAYLKLGHRFHEIIIHACRNNILIQFLETTTVFSESHRIFSLNAEMRHGSPHLEQSIREHLEIYEALKTRRGDLADKLMVEHTLRTSKVFIKHLDEQKFG